MKKILILFIIPKLVFSHVFILSFWKTQVRTLKIWCAFKRKLNQSFYGNISGIGLVFLFINFPLDISELIRRGYKRNFWILNILKLNYIVAILMRYGRWNSHVHLDIRRVDLIRSNKIIILFYFVYSMPRYPRLIFHDMMIF